MRGAKCSANNVGYIRAVYAEMDIGEPLAPWPIEPSMIVESSLGKYHVYWVVRPEEPLNAEEFNGIEMRLVETYGSDPNAKDLARRLRLPGTWNVKPGRPPHLVKLIDASGARYGREELLSAFPPPRKRKPTSPKKRPLMGMHGRGLDRFVGQQQDGPLYSISSDDYRDWLRVGMALHAESNGSADGLALWNAWSAKSEKWSSGVCAEKWKSFSGDRGITGGTIFGMAEERGWVRMKIAPTVQKLRGYNNQGSIGSPRPNLASKDGGGGARPRIVIEGGRLSDMATEAQAHLLAAGVGIYQRGGKLWRPVTEMVDASDGRKTTSAALREVTDVYLRDVLCRNIAWVKPARGADRSPIPVNPPMDVAATVLERAGEWPFPAIVGVTSTPTL